MTLRRRDIAGLAGLTAARLAARQAEMAALAVREGDLRQRIADLGTAARLRAQTLAQGPDMAAQAGVDMRWHLWVDQRREALLRDLALVLAEKERLRSALSLSFGRDQVAQELRDRAEAAHRLRSRARTEDSG